MLKDTKKIFIIGIKGVAMANLAVIFNKMGKDVTGADLEEEFITDRLLKKHGILFSVGFSPENLHEGTDLVIYSAAHSGINNPIALEAKKRGIALISQAEILGLLMKQFKTKIAVAGCHGKTTTSALLSYALIKLGAKPSYLVGASSFSGYDGGDYAANDYFVVEADEYGVNPPLDIRPKFHFLNPDYVICTNIDFDHPDVYKNLKSAKDAFLKFFQKKSARKLILCADDLNLYQSIDRLKQSQYLTYGFLRDANYIISDLETLESGTKFNVNNDEFSISLFGEKNVSNATAVIVILLNLGFSAEKIRISIKDFTGAKRRFEKIYENRSYSLYDDYGHHPREIEATISAARTHFPKRRIIVIFQPHTYSRTQMLLKEFAKALSSADYSFILPIFPSAREDKTKFSVKSEDIVTKGDADKLSYVKDHFQLTGQLEKIIQKGDVIFTMGAGDVYKLKDDIVKLLISNS